MTPGRGVSACMNNEDTSSQRAGSAMRRAAAWLRRLGSSKSTGLDLRSRTTCMQERAADIMSVFWAVCAQPAEKSLVGHMHEFTAVHMCVVGRHISAGVNVHTQRRTRMVWCHPCAAMHLLYDSISHTLQADCTRKLTLVNDRLVGHVDVLM